MEIAMMVIGGVLVAWVTLVLWTLFERPQTLSQDALHRVHRDVANKEHLDAWLDELDRIRAKDGE